MSITLKYGIACATFVLTIASPQMVSAGKSGSVASSAAAASSLTDVSARRKHARHRAIAAAPQPHREWTGADPTKGKAEENIRQMQREGRCIIDEGYGRYSGCSND